MLTGLMPEKQAESMAYGFEKDAFSWKTLFGGIDKAIRGGVNMATAVPETIWRWGSRGATAAGLLALAGASTGALGASALDVLNSRITSEDPEERFNNKVEALYANRMSELEDQKWMDRVRSMRDELRRDYKRMSTEEYAVKYKALQNALDERKA